MSSIPYYFAFICVYSFFAVNIDIKRDIHPVRMHDFVGKKPTLYEKVCIGVSCWTEVNANLKFFLDKYIGFSSVSNVVFSTYENCPNGDYNCIFLNYKKRENRTVLENYYVYHKLDMTLRMMQIKHFLEKTNTDWLLMINEKSIIYDQRFKEMIKGFLDLLNPRDNVLVYGNCLDIPDGPFLGKNSGYLISRKAGEQIYKWISWIIGYQFVPEEIRFTDIIKKLGLRMSDTSSGFFLENSFSKEDLDAIKLTRQSLSKCPPFNPQITCGRDFFSLNSIAISHNFSLNSLDMILGRKHPSNVYYYMNNSQPVLCNK